MAARTIIHLSDLHIGRRQAESDRLARVIARIATDHAQIPVLISGDLTDSATAGQMLEARELLDELARTNPVLTVPGNHDYGWKGTMLRADSRDNWVEILGEPLGWPDRGPKWMTEEGSAAGIDGLGIWPSGNLVFFGVDSGDPTDEVNTARGFIGKRLARALGDQLQRFAGKTRVVFLHHHPFAGTWFTALTGSKRLLAALAGNCEVLLFGHKHKLGLWRPWRDQIPLVIASHKSTNTVFGDHLMINVIEIEGAGTRRVRLNHGLELV